MNEILLLAQIINFLIFFVTLSGMILLPLVSLQRYKRKAKQEKRKNDALQMSISPDLLRRLEAKADAEGLKLEEFLESYLEDEENPLTDETLSTKSPLRL